MAGNDTKALHEEVIALAREAGCAARRKRGQATPQHARTLRQSAFSKKG